MSRFRLLIFSKFPQPGKAKTRLIPALGAEGAASIQKHLTEKTAASALKLSQKMEVNIEFHFTGASLQEMISWLGEGSYHPQLGNDLGQRMHSSFQRCFVDGAEKVVLVGSDIPGLNHQILQEAMQRIDSQTVSIGPSRDGGYYLLGLHHTMLPVLAQPLFTTIPWSSGDVFQLTSARVADSGYRLHLLPELLDIDLPEDLDQARLEGLM